MTTNTYTYTLNSGETVELPNGITPCNTPAAVTQDVGRFRVVGTTRSGRSVWSSYSCAAYTRAAHTRAMRAAVAKMRDRASELVILGYTVKAQKLRAEASRREVANDWQVGEWAADPAPCTCPTE